MSEIQGPRQDLIDRNNIQAMAETPYVKMQRLQQAFTRERTRADRLESILTHMKDQHKERAAGKLWNGPHGACSTCMLPYPCKVAQAITEAESES